MKQIKKKTNNGITLVALVVTIIILLMLSGITIQAITTDNGLFEKTKEAKEKYNKAEIMEKIQTEVLASYDNKGDLELGKIKDNITKNIDGATIEGEEFPITVTVDGKKFLVNESGKVRYDEKGSTTPGDKEEDEDSLVRELPSGLKDKLKDEVKKIENLDIAKTNPVKAMPSETTEIIDGNANKGIVIKDTQGNEWVWVDVPFSVTKNATTDAEIETALQGYATDYRSGYTDVYYNGCGLSESDYNTNKSKMLQSIKTNGGFWIGRYEAGIENSNTNIGLARKSHTEITEESVKAVSKPDHLPYNYIYCSEAQTLANKMYDGTDKTSSLMFGIQWNLVCKFLEVKGKWNTEAHTVQYYIKNDSTDWGNFKNKSLNITSTKAKQSTDNGNTWNLITETKPAGIILLTTGATTEARKMNIYDFAGNEWEWTLEKSNSNSSPCVVRGGCYNRTGNDRQSSGSWNFDTFLNDYDLSFRPTLY